LSEKKEAKYRSEVSLFF